NYSVAVGLQSGGVGTRPRISGDRSMVLFFDGGAANANSGYNFTDTDKFALIGGEFQIDDAGASANKGWIRYNSGTTKLEFSHDCSVATPTYTEFGGGGDFVSLSDTPASYTGQANKYLRVNGAANAVEYTGEIIVGSVSGAAAPIGAVGAS